LGQYAWNYKDELLKTLKVQIDEKKQEKAREDERKRQDREMVDSRVRHQEELERNQAEEDGKVKKHWISKLKNEMLAFQEQQAHDRAEAQMKNQLERDAIADFNRRTQEIERATKLVGRSPPFWLIELG
jgi:uncharacterized membrane-anchored protein